MRDVAGANRVWVPAKGKKRANANGDNERHVGVRPGTSSRWRSVPVPFAVPSAHGHWKISESDRDGM